MFILLGPKCRCFTNSTRRSSGQQSQYIIGMLVIIVICIAHMISCDHIVVEIISWTKSWYRLQGHSQYRRYITLMMCILYVFYTVDANGLGDPVRRSHITKSIVHEGNDEVELHVVISKNSRATRV